MDKTEFAEVFTAPIIDIVGKVLDLDSSNLKNYLYIVESFHCTVRLILLKTGKKKPPTFKDFDKQINHPRFH